MFSDVPGFQSIVPHCKPTNVVLLLNDLFTKFDRLVTLHEVVDMPKFLTAMSVIPRSVRYRPIRWRQSATRI